MTLMTYYVFCAGIIGWTLFFMERRKLAAARSYLWTITNWWMDAKDKLDALETKAHDHDLNAPR